MSDGRLQSGMANSSERPAHLSLRGTPDHTGMNDVDEVGGAVSPPNSRARASGLRALTGNVLKCGHAWQTVRMGDKGGVFWHTGRSHENTSIASAWSLGCKSRKEPVASELGCAEAHVDQSCRFHPVSVPSIRLGLSVEQKPEVFGESTTRTRELCDNRSDGEAVSVRVRSNRRPWHPSIQNGVRVGRPCETRLATVTDDAEAGVDDGWKRGHGRVALASNSAVTLHALM